MNIPFTAEQFLEIFESYNLAIWPMQMIAYLLSIAAVLLAIKKIRYSDRIISAVLSFYWLWMGAVILGWHSVICHQVYRLISKPRTSPYERIAGDIIYA